MIIGYVWRFNSRLTWLVIVTQITFEFTHEFELNGFFAGMYSIVVWLIKLIFPLHWPGFVQTTIKISGGGRGGLEGLEPPQLSRKGGRAPPKLYVCDVINIS